MIQFTHETTRFTVQPGNAQAYRAALDKPAKHKPEALTSVNLKRAYPKFKPGMTTGDYISQFSGLNSGILLKPIEYTHADRAAPMLDPSIPEVVEEVDPDYVEPVKATKPKKAKQTNETHAQALRAIALLTHDGSPGSVRIAFEHAQRIALGALEGVAA